MSAAQNETSLESLQCHFTWDLNRPRSILSLLMDKLDDVHTEGNRWLGHIYNLQGFIRYKLGFTEDAKSLFTKAAEAFKLKREEDEGPWLVVNYGNLAWLHHDLGQAEESQTYVSKVDALMKKYPSPSMDELHPEIYAEKGWAMMYLRENDDLVVEYFEKAARMQPHMVEWHTSYVIALINAEKYSGRELEADFLEKMRISIEQDPENLYLAALYVEQRGNNGERINDETNEIGRRILTSPISSFDCWKALLRVYRKYLNIDEAIDLAEEALREHPDSRYLKRCVAFCYKCRLMNFNQNPPRPGMMHRAISVHEELISLYPHSSFKKKLDLAFIYSKSSHKKKNAEQIYQELLDSDLQPTEKVIINHKYAEYLNFERNDRHGSIKQHMKAAAIPVKSFFREKSIRILEKARDKGFRSRDIKEFLEKLPEPSA